MADLDRAANQFPAEFDELFDSLLEDGKLRGVICLDDRFPFLDDADELITEFVERIAIFFNGGSFRRHVDAPGFHHHGIDQRIDALDIERRYAGGLDGFREIRNAAGVVIGQRGDGRGQQRKQGENRIELGRERKARPNRKDRARSKRFHICGHPGPL